MIDAPKKRNDKLRPKNPLAAMIIRVWNPGKGENDMYIPTQSDVANLAVEGLWIWALSNRLLIFRGNRGLKFTNFLAIPINCLILYNFRIF